MKLSQITQTFACLVIVNCIIIGRVQAISFDDIFDYFLDGLVDSEESQDLSNANLNVTCKNCNVTVECQNCTQSHKDTQPTVTLKPTTPINPQVTPSSLPSPAPVKKVEIISSNNPPSDSITTSPQSSTTVATSSTTTNTRTEPPQTANPKSNGDVSDIAGDASNLTTDEMSDSSDGVTGETN